MRVITICTAAAVMFALCGARVLAQELMPTPDPISGPQAGAPSPAGPATDATATPAADQWRYRWFDGHWWYWTPQNQWMWYGDNGWVAYDTAVPYTAAYGAYPVPVPVPSTGFYYPGYWYGGRYYYRPGVYVGVGGMRVGVGGGGGVRVRVGGYRYR